MASGKKRSTVEVKRMLQFANTQLARKDQFATMELKMGVCVMIEEILHRTNNYAGFNFHDLTDTETGTPGSYNRFYYENEFLRKISN